MKRRDILKSSVFLAGCGLSAGTIASIVSGCKSEPQPYADSFLGNDRVALLGEIVETIIPTTDTPGAREAGVHIWMDQAVRDNFAPEEQEQFKAALDGIAEAGFEDLGEKEREGFLLSITAEEGQPNPFDILKSMTCQGYFSSEIGAKQALAFDPIPGEWKACIDYDEVGKAWAILR